MSKTSGSFKKGHKYCGPRVGSFFGKKHSEESKIKIREKKLGRKYPNRKSPPPFTEEHRENIRIAGTGLKRTGTALQHIIETNQKPWTEERRIKFIKSMIGRECSKETREKIKQSRLKNPTRYWLGKKRPNQTGEKNPAWIDGRTPENVKIRNSPESDIWRYSIFKRYDYTCQKTGIKGGKLVAHHILNFSQYPELRFDVNNGITLSKDSHIEFHKIYGKQNNTREQLEEFLKN